MPEIVFTTRGAEGVNRAHDLIDRRGKTTQKVYQQTAKEAQYLGRLEQKILRDTETARERYNRRLGETSRALGVSPRTFDDLVLAGLIGKVQIGGLVLFDVEELREFVRRVRSEGLSKSRIEDLIERGKARWQTSPANSSPR